MAPLFFYLLGCDQYSKLWMSYLVVLLLAVLILKRFVWRHRPFTVKRAKMVSTDYASVCVSVCVCVCVLARTCVCVCACACVCVA